MGKQKRLRVIISLSDGNPSSIISRVDSHPDTALNEDVDTIVFVKAEHFARTKERLTGNTE